MSDQRIDILDATPTMDRNMAEAVRLLEAVRTSGRQADMLKFVAHMRATAREADEAMGAGIAMLDSAGALDDAAFARIYAAGCSHATMVLFCSAHAEDPSEAVRMACAAGTIVLHAITISPDHARVIENMRKRLDGAA